MEKGDLESGEADLVQDNVQSSLDFVASEDNDTKRLSTSTNMAHEIMLCTKVGKVEMNQGSVVQRLLCRFKKEDSHMNPPSIYKVPGPLRDLSPSSFEPRVVSIGPLHREHKNVKAFEGRKASYLTSLMQRTKSPEDILKLCVKKVYDSMEEIKACYVWTKTYDDADIADIMVMDACFILEFLLKFSESDEELNMEGTLIIQNVFYDLVLLENQIPFFILDEIFQCTELKFNDESSFVKLILQVLDVVKLFNADIEVENDSFNNIHHILSLVHQCYKPPDNITECDLNLKIPSVVNLKRAGVNFKPNKDSTWVMGMEVKTYGCPFFCSCKCTLRIPVLIVADYTELMLRNLIAYEQTFQTSSYVSSYAVVMDMLVDTQEDVVKLVDSKVLDNDMGSNEEVANMINNIAKEVVYEKFSYQGQYETLNEYYKGYWPKNIAKMRSTYFSNPWSAIALLAGFIIFCLTVVQTIFTIKSG